MWNELAKYVPFICAAYAKYSSVGPLADWAKMVLPPDEVKEFASDKLLVPFTVARELSIKYGSSSGNLIEGASKNQTVTEIVMIVRIAGGARTIDVMALRNWRYNGYENRALVRELDTCAGDTIPDSSDDQSSGSVIPASRVAHFVTAGCPLVFNNSRDK